MSKTINIITAKVLHSGHVYNLSNWCGTTRCIETGKNIKQTRRDFRNWLKTFEKHYIYPNLKTGQYVNINTGEIESVFGIQ